MKKVFGALALTFISFSATADYSQDTNIVSRVYANANGAIALQLNGGFPKAVEAKQCPNNNGWAGLLKSDGVIKSAIIAAKSSGQQVTVTIEGCEGAWLKIKDIYMN